MPVQTQMQVRRGTASSWTSTNPTLAAGELGFETDTGNFKIGTGSSTWNALLYAGSRQSLLTIDAKTGTSYTFSLGDSYNELITADNSSAQTYSIPTNASVAFPIGTQINIIGIGTGLVTINAVTSGTTTIQSTGTVPAEPKLRARYSTATLIKAGTDLWYVIGDIS